MLPSEMMSWQPEFTDKTLSRKPGAVQTCTEKIPEENNTISMDLTREAVKMVEEQMTGHKGNIRGTVSTQRELEKKFATAAGKHTARDVLT